MKLLKDELANKGWDDAYNKVNEHAPWNSPVSQQIRKNFGLVWSDNNLIRSKIHNPNMNIRNNLDETN